MDITLVSTADWDNPYWTNKQHVALRLARLGHKVLYVESQGLRRPSATTRDFKRVVRRLSTGLRGPRLVAENLVVVSPIVIPYHGSAVVRQLNRVLLRISLYRARLKSQMSKEVLWTYSPITTKLYSTEDFDSVVYHRVDDIKQQPGVNRSVIEDAELDLMRSADIVFATSVRLATSARDENANTHYLGNVADFAHFSQAMDADTIIPPDISSFPRPRIGFIGAISSYKLDLNLITSMAIARPHMSFIFIGEVGEGDPSTDLTDMKNIKNLFFLGGRPYQELPRYLKAFDVAILPSSINEYTQSMFPMKFFEYLAAGVPIVSVRLPALSEYSDVATFCGSNPADFLKGIDSVLRGEVPPLLSRLDLARQQTYEARTEKMISLIMQTSRRRAHETTISL